MGTLKKAINAGKMCASIGLSAGVALAIVIVSALIGAFWGGLMTPFDQDEEEFAKRLADGTALAFLAITFTTAKLILRRIPQARALHRIETSLVVSVMCVWFFLNNVDQLFLVLILIGWVAIGIARQIRHQTQAKPRPATTSGIREGMIPLVVVIMITGTLVTTTASSCGGWWVPISCGASTASLFFWIAGVAYVVWRALDDLLNPI